MKLKYLLFALLAVGSQPSLAAEPASGLGETAIEPAAAVAAVRRQELQRVADALTAEASAKAAVNTQDAAPAIKARFKAMKRPSPSAEQPDCDDCPDKAVAPGPDSASQVRNRDCIDCVEEAILA
jgi:flagellar hook-length control protein FliK